MRSAISVATTLTTLAVTTAACSSSTYIQTRPSGAAVFLDGEHVGSTPYLMQDSKIVGSTTHLRLELPGYETLNAAIQRNEDFSVGACIGGVFLLVPFLWIMGYKDTHSYELRPMGGGGWDGQPQPPPNGGSPWDQPPPPSWGTPPPPSWGTPPQPPPPPPPPPRR